MTPADRLRLRVVQQGGSECPLEPAVAQHHLNAWNLDQPSPQLFVCAVQSPLFSVGQVVGGYLYGWPAYTATVPVLSALTRARTRRARARDRGTSA
jgi:hypothetical protein